MHGIFVKPVNLIPETPSSTTCDSAGASDTFCTLLLCYHVIIGCAFCVTCMNTAVDAASDAGSVVSESTAETHPQTTRAAPRAFKPTSPASKASPEHASPPLASSEMAVDQSNLASTASSARLPDPQEFVACHRIFVDDVSLCLKVYVRACAAVRAHERLVLTYHITLVQLLECLRREMLLMSKFEAVVSDDAAAEKTLDQYMHAVKDLADARATLSQKFLGQFGLSD